MNAATTTLLTSSPAQTCIALAAGYSYGKQGLPDLPTRLRLKKNKSNNNNNNSRRHSSSSKQCSSCTPPLIASSSSTATSLVGGSFSSKRKTPTGTTASSALNKKDLLYTTTAAVLPAPSPYRHYYDDKISLLSSTLTNSAVLTSITKGLLSQNSNESITSSSNSTSSNNNVNKARRRKNKGSSSRDNKKVTVIKKKSKSKSNNGKVNNHSHRHLRPQTSVMEKSSTCPAAAKTKSVMNKTHLCKEGLVNERRKKYGAAAATDAVAGDDYGYDNVTYFPDEHVDAAADDDDDDELQPKSTILFSSLSSIPGRDSSSIIVNGSASDDDNMDNGENSTSKQENGEDKKSASVIMKNDAKVQCAALPLLKQRLGYLWEKKMFTDVVFIVGRNSQNIEAHRVILASCSKVFQNLLYGEGKPLQNCDEKYILYENDFSEPALEVFIKAMYTNEIPICLTLAMALEVFYATKKYAVIFLEDQVLEHIRQLLSISNVFEALRFSTNAVELSYLAPICWRIVEERTAEVLEYHLKNLEAHMFARILERERLSVDEVQLFQYAIRWAANICKKNGMKVTGKNKRHFMEPLLKHFRFTTIHSSQFNEVVAPSRILEPKEILQIQNSFNKTADLKNITLPYKTMPRVNTAIQLSARDYSSSNNNNHSSEVITESTSVFRLSTPKGCYNGGHNIDGSGDGLQVQMICSDSVVIAPSVGSKMHFNGNGGGGGGSSSSGNKKGTSSSSTKLKSRRVSTSGKAAR